MSDIDRILKDLNIEPLKLSKEELTDYFDSLGLHFIDDVGIEHNIPKKKVIKVNRPTFTTKIK